MTHRSSMTAPARSARTSRSVALPIAVLSILAAACSRKAPPAPQAGPVEVGVVTIAPTPVTLTRELPGRTSAVRVAEVRARVNGIVLKRSFVEGSDVKAGQLLFQIDPAPYQAALDSARAALARSEANLANAKIQAGRFTELVQSNAVSRQEYDNAIATLKATEADVAAGRAAVQTAKINLGYTTVTAPVSGRIGRSAVTEGAYVQAGQATLLATIQQIDKLYVDLTQSTTDVLRLKRELEAGKLQSAGAGAARVTLLLEDGSEYGQPGSLEFRDITVDPTTGSITLRAIFPNPRSELLPGMFVRARLQEAVDPQALLVPQAAVTRDQKGQAIALVVTPDNKVERRQIMTDRTVGESWLVSGGIAAGDRVIVDGLQKVRPGAAVKPVPASGPKQAAR